MLDEEDYSPSAGDPFDCRTPRKRKSKNKMRFSDEQIRSLETIFESETRLEPRKKLQLSKELGLQPRQVAIWFQNKRARWKSKQLERDYSLLRANYNSLASRVESLKKEKQALVIQLQKLNSLIRKPTGEEGKVGQRNGTANAGEGESDNGDTIKYESDSKPGLSFERSEHRLEVLSDENSSIKSEYFGLEEQPNLINIVEPAESLTSQEDWSSLDSDAIFDQSSCDYQWWDFWA